MRTILSFLISLSLVTTASAQWPQFRGPTGQGHAESTGLPVEWSETTNVRWKTPLPGLGHSSPVIENGKIWLTTAIDRRTSSEDIERRTKDNTASEPLIVSDHVSLRAVCVDAKTGKLLHNIELLTEDEPQWIHLYNSYATPTPVIENGLLYCHFGTFGTACLDTESQKILWTNRDQRVMHENGPASTPVLWRDLVIFHCDGSDKQYIAALNKKDGQLAWKTERSGEMHADPQTKKSYGTPLIVPLAGQDQIISPAANWLYGYDPQTGKELWKASYQRLGFSIVVRPVVGHGMIYMSTCYPQSELLAFQYDDADPPEIAWRYAKQVPAKSSPLLVGDELYMVSNNGGIATCLDAQTGQVNWTSRILGS
ncbi:MAG: PQQ-like beta-propeller repeat protein, partial [Planctomycetales bacterium]